MTKKTKKKPAKKAAKKKAGKRPEVSPARQVYLDAQEKGFKILAQVELKPGVEELLVANEAKLYLTGIQRARAKLQAFIDRELAKQRHPAHPEHDPKA